MYVSGGKMMSRLRFYLSSRYNRVFLSWAVSAACVSSVFGGEEESLPNIVLILADDLGWSDVGYQDPAENFYETPNIDRLAQQSIVFSQAYAAAPLCTPSRAAILTGKYPGRLGLDRAISHSHGQPFHAQDPKPADPWNGLPWRKTNLYQNRNYLPLEEITFAELLRQHGYATGLLGKWHLGAGDFLPASQGFDYVLGGTPQGNPGTYFYPFQVTDKGRPGDYLTDYLATEAEQFIEQHRDHPFLLFVSHYAVHTPLQAKPDRLAYYQQKAERLGIDHKDPVYAAMIEHLDDSVGRIAAKLDAEGLSENTLLVFMSDNGGMVLEGYGWRPVTDNLPFSGGKAMSKEGGLRVPLLVRWPAKTGVGGRCEVPVCGIDLYSTFCDAAGVSVPEDQDVDGQSLMPLLCNRFVEWDSRDLYFHWPYFLRNQLSVEASRTGEWGQIPCTAIRSGKYKYVRYYQDDREELFNLEEDPAEQNDLSSVRVELCRDFASRIDDWTQAKVADFLPAENRAYASGYGVPIRNYKSVWVPYHMKVSIDDHNLILDPQGDHAFVRTTSTEFYNRGDVKLDLVLQAEKGGSGRIVLVSSKTEEFVEVPFEFAGGQQEVVSVLLPSMPQYDIFQVHLDQYAPTFLKIDRMVWRQADSESMSEVWDFGFKDVGNWK
jgi:arylsulfatase A